MQGFLMLVAMLVVVGGFRMLGDPDNASGSSNTSVSFTARQMVQIADALGMMRAQGLSIPTLCPGLLPDPNLPVLGLDNNTTVYCTEYNDRIVIWTEETPGLAAALRNQSRDSKLLARVTEGAVITLADPALWSVSLPASVANGSLVYIN